MVETIPFIDTDGGEGTLVRVPGTENLRRCANNPICDSGPIRGGVQCGYQKLDGAMQFDQFYCTLMCLYDNGLKRLNQQPCSEHFETDEFILDEDFLEKMSTKDCFDRITQLGLKPLGSTPNAEKDAAMCKIEREKNNAEWEVEYEKLRNEIWDNFYSD